MESSKLNRYSLLVEHFWQAWCQSTLRYPAVVWQDLYPLKVKGLQSLPLCVCLFYTSSVLTSLTSYATSLKHHCMMLWWYHVLFSGKPMHMHSNRWVGLPHSECIHLCCHTQTTSTRVINSNPGQNHDIYMHVMYLAYMTYMSNLRGIFASGTYLVKA